MIIKKFKRRDVVDSWIINETKNTNLKDLRLEQRLAKIIDQLSATPSASIPEACQTAAATKAAYRFFDNDNVDADAIREGFFIATAKRINDYETVLVASDITDLNYIAHKALKSKGVLRNFKASGLIMHSALAMSVDGLPLGLLDQMFWYRKSEDYGKRIRRADLPIEEKESYRWVQSLSNVAKQMPAKTKWIFVGDRGADIYELFLNDRPANCELLIRMLHNRRLSSKSKLFDVLENIPTAGTMTIELDANAEREKRTAICDVRYTTVTLKSPMHKDLPQLTINAIYLKENTAEVSNSIEWRLLTTAPINCLEDAVKYIGWYVKRWVIERYHFTLKSGCKIEELQLEEAERINRALAVYSIIAWRLMSITYLARTNPDDLCTNSLSNDEWKALHCFVHKVKNPPEIPPTMQKAILMLARLGGFLGRKNDGDPGMKVVWRGLRRLDDIVETYKIFAF